MESCKLIVTYVTKKGMRETFLNELIKSGVVDTIRNEEGCIYYDYYLSFQDENIIILLENWASRENLEAHLAQPHMNTVRALKEIYVENSTLEEIQYK
jgi:quinol monooxygenase YgiN